MEVQSLAARQVCLAACACRMVWAGVMENVQAVLFWKSDRLTLPNNCTENTLQDVEFGYVDEGVTSV